MSLAVKRQRTVAFPRSFPGDVLRKASDFLTLREIGRLETVSKVFKAEINWKVWKKQCERIGISRHDQFKQVFSNPQTPVALGPAAWARHFGMVNDPPPLHPEIYEILREPCPFWEDKRVTETHLLVLIPRMVGGELMNLRRLGDCCQVIMNGIDQDKPVEKSHWILMTKEVIPGSRNISYAAQKEMVAKIGYELPPMLDAVAAILMKHQGTGIRLFGDAPTTYTRCQEQVGIYPLMVGGFAVNGMWVHQALDINEVFGAAASRRL